MNDSNMFKAITNFVNELGEMYGEKHKPLRLYQHLISKTQSVHTQAISKHIEAFRKFCVENKEAVLNKDVSKLNSALISYSERVYIDMSVIFSFADSDAKSAIWQHLLCIYALVDPSGKAKEILKKNMEDGLASGNETNFLTDIISKVESSVGDQATNPMDAIGSVMSSGVLNDLIGGMQNGLQNGQLDLSKLMGTIQGMVKQMNSQVGDNPQAQQMMGMINNMTSMMGNMGSDEQKMQAPDMGAMMSQMMGLMQGNGNMPTIEEVENEIEGVDEKETQS